MKYLTVLLFIILAWFLLEEFVFQDRKSEGLETYGDKWKDLGRRLHLVFGILAVAAVILLAMSYVVSSMGFHW